MNLKMPIKLAASHQKLWLAFALAGCTLSSMTACVPLVVGGAAVGGLVATDRRASGSYLNDEGIELRANNRILEATGDRAHVNVTSYNGQVLLTGEVPTPEDKQRIDDAVKKIDNVKSIVNELVVATKSSLADRSSDALITGRVKASLLDTKDLFANAFKVVTERGTVYMMGRVTQRESARATDLARATNGVQRVVRLFEILTEEELQGLPKTN